MEKMRIELTAAGHDVGFLVINKIDAEDTQQKLLNQGSFPMVQDIAGVNVWQLMSGSKDDFYLFGKDGRLAKFLPVSGDNGSVDLSSDEGYNNLKDSILTILAD